MSTPKSRVAVVQNGKICPICGKRSYSAGGTHPQCAVRRADAQQRLKLKAEAEARELAASSE